VFRALVASFAAMLPARWSMAPANPRLSRGSALETQSLVHWPSARTFICATLLVRAARQYVASSRHRDWS